MLYYCYSHVFGEKTLQSDGTNCHEQKKIVYTDRKQGYAVNFKNIRQRGIMWE